MNEAGTNTAPEGQNLAEALRVAESKLNEATRAKRVTDQQIAEATAAVEVAEREFRDARRSGHFVDQNQANLSRAQGALEAARAKHPQAARDFNEAEVAVRTVRQKIADHPVYREAVSEQHELAREADALAHRAWHETPLVGITDVTRKSAALLDREDRWIAGTNQKLRESGLPEIRGRVRQFFSAIFPTDLDLQARAGEAAQSRRKMLDF